MIAILSQLFHPERDDVVAKSRMASSQAANLTTTS